MGQNGDDPIWSMLDRIERTETIDQLGERYISAASAFGFDAAYFLAPVAADPRIGRNLTNFGFSVDWEAHYRKKDYLNDPLPGLALANGATLRWPEQVEEEHLSKSACEYLHRLSEGGAVSGIAVPCYGPFARYGFVALRLPHQGAAQNKAAARTNIQKAVIVTRSAFRRYVFIERPFKQEFPGLSSREAQVLHWIAAGKSSNSIGQITGLSPASVNEYVRRIFAKLGVNNRTTASVQALALGLIIAGDYPGKNQPSPEM